MTARRSSPGRHRGGSSGLRILVSVALLGVLVLKAPNPDELLPEPAPPPRPPCCCVPRCSCTLLGVVLSAWRWQRVLLVFDARVPLRPLIGHYFAGQFVGNVLPSTIGGDVLRVSRGPRTRSTRRRSRSASVVLERLTGFVALPLLVFARLRRSGRRCIDVDHAWIALLIAGHHARRPRGRSCSSPATRGSPAASPSTRTGPGSSARCTSASTASATNPRQLIAVLGTAIVYQLSVVLTVALIFRTLDLPVPLARALAFVPAVAMVQVLPISFSGLGVREGALVLFLHPLGRQQRRRRSPSACSGTC